MKTKIEFFEVQKQTQKWIWFLMMFLTVLILWVIVQQLIIGVPVGNHPAPDWALFIILGFLLLFLVFLKFGKLETKIDENGVSYRYVPFQKEFRFIAWSEIEKSYVRIYRPIKEYGGWGMRTAFNGGNGSAYNVAGNIGLQLELKNGKRFLLGTQKGKEIESVLKSIQSLKA